MYHHLRGKLVELSSLNAVVETSGVGWDVHVPLSTSSLLGEGLGEEVLLYTHLLVREDVLKLFGFLTMQERVLFRLLLSVSGTGPAIALQALSAFTVGELISDLSSGDVNSLKRIKGVGKKLAERLVLELRDKTEVLLAGLEIPGVSGTSLQEGKSGRVHELALSALVELGYSARDARSRVETAWQLLRERMDPGSAQEETIRAEDVIREALKNS
ncbi:MAG: Holliday junction branch migration protein RuvA [Planctomycetota bacterium]